MVRRLGAHGLTLEETAAKTLHPLHPLDFVRDCVSPR